MQTETRSNKKDEGTTVQRRERPRQFDAGIRIQAEPNGGHPTFAAWGQGQHAGSYGQNLVTGQGASMFANPMATLAPTLSYGLAGLADLLYRGVALATSQGQALINSIRPTQQPLGALTPQVAWPAARFPATDIVDEGAEFVCQVELPGVKPENVEVSCFGGALLVTASSEPEIDLGALVQAERGVETTYRRAVNLPAPVQPSGAKAKLRDGILTVNLPKVHPTEAPRRIPVTSAN